MQHTIAQQSSLSSHWECKWLLCSQHKSSNGSSSGSSSSSRNHLLGYMARCCVVLAEALWQSAWLMASSGCLVLSRRNWRYALWHCGLLTLSQAILHALREEVTAATRVVGANINSLDEQWLGTLDRWRVMGVGRD
jgi:hypothetical protein